MTNRPCKDIAILVPAYNEEKTILNVLLPLLAYSAHIIVVADGCTDNTISTIAHLPITILKNHHNQGKGACLQKGFSYLKGKPFKGVITIDADGQHEPHDIKHIINAINQDSESIIIGARQGKKLNCPKSRYYANKLTDLCMSFLLKKNIEDSQSGFRFYPQSFIERNLESIYKRFGYESLLLLIAKKHQVTIKCTTILALYPEENRKSYYAPIADSLTISFILLVNLIQNIPLLFKDYFFDVKKDS